VNDQMITGLMNWNWRWKVWKWSWEQTN